MGRLPSAARLLPATAMATTLLLLVDVAIAGARHGESARPHLDHVGLLPAILGLLAATLLAVTASCSSAPLSTWRGRATAAATAVVAGVVAQEITALCLGVEHFGGTQDALAHLLHLALPAAGVCAAVAAAGIGVRHAVAPVGRWVATLVFVRPSVTPHRQRRAAEPAHLVRTGLRLLRHLLGPAPPAFSL